MSTITIDTEVDVDVNSIICEIDSDDLIKELEKRGISNYNEEGQSQLLEELYYALRDGNMDKAITIINPMIEDVTGRRV